MDFFYVAENIIILTKSIMMSIFSDFWKSGICFLDFFYVAENIIILTKSIMMSIFSDFLNDYVNFWNDGTCWNDYVNFYSLLGRLRPPVLQTGGRSRPV